MKNLTLGFLVFITILSKGQSVNPETFPTVVGAIGSKNLYTNTGGEGKISVQSIIDSAKLISGAFIPLSGTEVGKPVSGDIEISDPTLNPVSIYEGDLLATSKGFRMFKDDDSFEIFSKIDGNDVTRLQVDNDGFVIQVNDIGINSPRGFIGSTDFSPNITDLDYTQKIYVDKKVAKIGTDDIEITDFNKGVILTAPNSSRYRITVDNAGTLITTLIP